MVKPSVISITKPIALKTTKEINGLWYADLDIEIDDYIAAENYVDIDSEQYIVRNIRKIRVLG